MRRAPVSCLELYWLLKVLFSLCRFYSNSHELNSGRWGQSVAKTVNISELFFRQFQLHSSTWCRLINKRGDNIVPFDDQLGSHFSIGCQIVRVWKSWLVTLNISFLMNVTDRANLSEISFVVVLDDDELIDNNVSQCFNWLVYSGRKECRKRHDMPIYIST